MRTVIKLFFPLLSCFAPGGTLRAEDSAKLEAAPPPAERSLSLSTLKRWDFKGVFRTEFEVYQKPSGLAGNSEFHIPYASVEGLGEVLPSVKIDFEISYNSPITPTDEPVKVQRFAAIYRPAGAHNVDFSFGLIEPAFSALMKEDWAYDNLTPGLFWPGARWGYWFASDYGLQMSQWEENISWGLGVVNGEGPLRRSQRAQKEAFIWADWKFASNFERQNHLLIHASRGAYDNVPTTDASKDRLVISLWTRARLGFSMGAELWSLRDPADSITLKAAGGVDLTTFGGERVKGQLLSSHGSYRFGQIDAEQYEFFYRSDRVDPVLGHSELRVTADNFGFLYSPQPGVDWVFLFSDVDYGDGHSRAARDQQLWRLSFNVTWD